MPKKSKQPLPIEDALVALENASLLGAQAIARGCVPLILLSVVKDQPLVGTAMNCQLCAVGELDEDSILRILKGAVKQIEAKQNHYDPTELN